MGSVYFAVSVPRNVSAKTNSFQAKINANTLVATRPGATSGSRIRQKTRTGPAPSMAAASSSSRGTAATKLRSIQIVTGSANAVYTPISPTRLSSRAVQGYGVADADPAGGSRPGGDRGR